MESCQVGYYNFNNVCTKCPEGCLSCLNATSCTKCRSQTSPDGVGQTNLQLSNGICVPCFSKCLYCSGLPNNCTACPVGKFLNGSNCVNCDQSCLTCSGSSPNACLTCPDGFFLNNQSYCMQCSENCKRCVRNAQNCVECDLKLLRTLDNGECVTLNQTYMFYSQINDTVVKCEDCNKCIVGGLQDCVKCPVCSTTCNVTLSIITGKFNLLKISIVDLTSYNFAELRDAIEIFNLQSKKPVVFNMWKAQQQLLTLRLELNQTENKNVTLLLRFKPNIVFNSATCTLKEQTVFFQYIDTYP